MANEEDLSPAALVRLINDFPPAERLREIRSYLAAIDDPHRRRRVEQRVLAALEGNAALPPTVVVLVHGINTAAEWQQRLADQLMREEEIEAVPIGVLPVDLITFLFPFFGRWILAAIIAKKLKNVGKIHPGKQISVIAHSFGTYLVTRALLKNPDIKIQRLILCGSIVSMYFDWSKIESRISARGVVNDVGTKDYWPVMAFLGSLGYGPTGSIGFKDPYVRDRYFALDHSGFFTDSHLRDYWVPFLTEGHVVPSEHSSTRGTPPLWTTILPNWPAKLLFWLLVPTSLWIIGKGLWWLWRWLIAGSA
jgi:pimeloyl-ACP methyl ester carboxylesterase